MTRATIAVGAFASVFVFLALAVGYWAFEQDIDPAAPTSSESTPSTTPPETHPAAETAQGFLYGRISTLEGATYEGRLRWGGGEEAFWGDYFNGSKDENPWVVHVPAEQLMESHPIEIFGVEVGRREWEIDLGRPFMARFGDIAKIEARVGDVRVTLKSGTVFDLDRFDASDFDDGVRVWDGSRGVADLDSLRVRTIELLTTPSLGAVPYRLYGTVRTGQGDFTGFIQWNREKCVGSDELNGLRFDTIRSIERTSPESSMVTLLDGGEIALAGQGDRGIYVDDLRYGRVLISWDAFEHVVFSPGGSGPAYGDFPASGPLRGSVTTRAGDRFTGRLVFDLDESETIETLDAPFQGVDYTIPFGLIDSIVPSGGARRTRVTLQNGEELQLELAGDLGEGNAGTLIFIDGQELPEYVPWPDVEQVEFDPTQAMYPPLEKP